MSGTAPVTRGGVGNWLVQACSELGRPWLKAIEGMIDATEGKLPGMPPSDERFLTTTPACDRLNDETARGGPMTG